MLTASQYRYLNYWHSLLSSPDKSLRKPLFLEHISVKGTIDQSKYFSFNY